MAKTCVVCGKSAGLLGGIVFSNINGNDYCSVCAKKHLDDAIRNIIITTTNNLDGYRVKDYIDIESVEIVVGIGIFSEIGEDVSDFFDPQSSAFEKKLHNAKETAFNKLKYQAFEKGGNAVIGIALNYTEFSDNRMGLIANGTIVRVEKIA